MKAADGLHSYCKPCMRAKKWRARYGITPDEFEALRSAQDARCKLCGEHESESKQGLFVDHDHSHCSSSAGCPECVRGLLCRSCNMAIGLFRDRPELMEAAARYVRTRGKVHGF